MKCYVVCGTHAEFLRAKRELGDFVGKDPIYVSDATRLYGVRNARFVFYGTWLNRKDWPEIDFEVKRIYSEHSAPHSVN